MPSTPTYGFPYPALSDPPNGASQIQALATALESKFVTVDGTVATNSSNITNMTNREPVILAWGRRTTPSGTTTGTVGVLRLDDVQVKVGFSYRIAATNVLIDSTVASDTGDPHIRFTTDGSTPTTASTVMIESFGRIIVANSGEAVPLECQYEPASDQLLSLLLCVSRISGSGNMRLFASATAMLELKIERTGLAVGNTGTSI